FEATVKPRPMWTKRFKGDSSGQTWQLMATLADGEDVDLGNRLQCETWDFHRCLTQIRDGKLAKIRVTGWVWDAADYKRPLDHPAFGTPRDVRGKYLIAVEQLEVLGDEPAAVHQTPIKP
ncbi:unnamed protein product, partial [marine sediment metagenome]